MIDVVSRSELRRNRAVLEAMHRLRFRVFAERLGWDVPTWNMMERDEFDDLDPFYLLAHNDAGALVGTWRMLPTVGPYMLRDVFHQLLDGEPAPNDPRVWEGSRFAVDCRESLKDGMGSPSKVTGEIFCAVTEFALALDLTEIVTVYDARIARLLPRIGCYPKWQSRRCRIGNVTTLAGRFEISERVLQQIREANGINGSVVRNAPWIRKRTAA